MNGSKNGAMDSTPRAICGPCTIAENSREVAYIWWMMLVRRS